MLLTLEPLRAAEGDCLLLHWGIAAQPKLAIIDGGPGKIWETSLLPRLQQIADLRALPQLTIDLVLVSHVDNDHIVGIRKLFRRLKTEIAQALPVAQRTFAVRRLWHNTFNDILDDAIDAHYQTLTAGLQASVGGAPNPLLEERLAKAHSERYGGSADDAAGLAHDVALILAGHGEARELRDCHAFLRDAGEIAALNSPFEKKGQPTLITAQASKAPIDLAGLTITVLGPQEAEIAALQAAFDAFIAAKGKSVEAMLAAYSDRSVPNLSSIVCVVEAGGRRILLTGDARGDKILTALANAGPPLLVDGRFVVDVLKVPHHGSDRNLAQDFFDTIVADTYVLSGNGKHGNPERATLEWLTGSRKPTDQYTIVLTYPLADVDAGRQKHAVQHNEPWDPALHSLAALIDKRRHEGHQFTLVDGAPVKIELGDETFDW